MIKYLIINSSEQIIGRGETATAAVLDAVRVWWEREGESYVSHYQIPGYKANRCTWTYAPVWDDEEDRARDFVRSYLLGQLETTGHRLYRLA